MEKNATEQIRFQARNYKGFNFLDIRIYFQAGENWLPSKKGITLGTTKIKEFAEKVNKINDLFHQGKLF